MKNRHIIILAAISAATVLPSCNKWLDPAEDFTGEEIILGVGNGFEADVETKATAITSVPATLYWGATTGSTTETKKWDATSASTSSNKISTGQYQTATPTAYNYYVANKTFSVGAATTMTVADNNTDVLVGRTAASTSTTPSVVLNHIFCRTGSLTLNTQSGYNLSGVSWKIVGSGDIQGTAGTYNMTEGVWTAASTKLTSDTAITSTSDMYLIPGTYTIKCTYTLSKGQWSQTFTKSANVTLVQGKINNITATAVGGAASEIVISVSVTAWGTENITATF